jgi:hypothetical protein
MTTTQKSGVFIVLGLLVLAALIFAFDPSRICLFPSCLFHDLTGLYCPGCGATRATHQLLHGHLLEAIRFNALVVLLAPSLLGALLWERLSERRARPWSVNQLSPFLVWTLVSAVLLFGVARNIPLYPFTVIAP